ncbi:MAG: xanthine dehydrogenase family protein subunit M [Armatimonadota bacterium]|nr:xanthine dehydrogenase family protein subunit M [Armatimonadota bacterium]MDR7450628.1 xanthine dehydrogenase family protein subunit M [Armatimonadota bacterium]MDR7466239.1 xanthine dehydrogenase family protein subunit M [Armatimonadota bacterium]MDR7492960.1 xanthine dehydrogenase family protein subunit M [Armatimonadota bacterium]MDR7498283.1 xanthine dehydrogenase family protein subunit M [Armatimonadota bacterium]
MNPPRYLAPPTIAEAVRHLAEEGEGAYPLAGGTDLVVRMRAGLVQPTALVDLQRIPELAVIAVQDGRVWLGATVTLAKVVASPELRRLTPVLAEAAAQMGAVQLRNLATVGGNLASAVPSADLAPPLLVLDATARITGPAGERALPLEQFFAGPHRSVLRPGEILTGLEIPASDGGTGAAFLKFGRRSAQVLAVVNAAARVRLHRGVLDEVRIALGAVAPTPIRARSAEILLRGAPPDRERLDEAARLAAQEARPISDMRATAGFRREIAQVLVRRALEQAIRRAELEGLRHAL